MTLASIDSGDLVSIEDGLRTSPRWIAYGHPTVRPILAARAKSLR
jgi:hypothetical protein